MGEENNIVLLYDEDGNELNLEVLDIIEEGGKRYAVGVDAKSQEDEDTVLIMKITEAGEDEDILEPITDNDELMHIFEVFKERMSDEFEFADE